MNGAGQINSVTQLFIALAFKSQEAKNLIPSSTLRELGIQFSHQPREGPDRDLDPRLGHAEQVVNQRDVLCKAWDKPDTSRSVVTTGDSGPHF